MAYILNHILISDVPGLFILSIIAQVSAVKRNTVFTLNIWTTQILTVLVLKFEQVHLHVLPFDVSKITRLVATF